MVADYEDISAFGLDAAEQAHLLAAQNECTFVWSTQEGWPVGVTMSYLWRRERLWLTTVAQRKRVKAVRRDPRVSVIVSSAGLGEGPGRTITLKGRCAIRQDRPTIAWMLPELARAVFPDQARRQERFVARLDSPNRVVLEVTPEVRFSHDVRKLGRGGP